MQKFLQISSVGMALFIITGTYLIPDSALMTLAASGTYILILRELVVVGSVLLLVTKPPRSIFMRSALGMAAAMLGGWAVVNLYGADLPMLDGLLFVVASISFAIAALELPPLEARVQKYPAGAGNAVAGKTRA